MQFLTEVDKQVIRLGSELMLLQQIVEALRKENDDLRQQLNEVQKSKNDGSDKNDEPDQIL